MGQNWAGVYDYKSRDEFFKQGVFVTLFRRVSEAGRVN